MPITGPSSYVPTTEEFEQHWATADATLGVGNEIVLPDGTNQAGLTAKKDALVAKRADLQAKLNVKESSRGDVEIKKAALLGRLVMFNDKIRAIFPGSKWINALPNVPSQTDAQSKITEPMDDANSLWQQINADPATASPVTLLGGYDQATFNTDVAALKTAYTTLNSSQTTLKVTREERNDLQDDIYAVLKSYRQVLPTFFAEGDAMVTSLPRLTTLPGHTPDSVTANGQYVDPPGHASLSWTASTDTDLLRYEIRQTIGPVYDADSETVVGSVLAGTEAFTTTDGLANPGDIVTFRVYVILNTGNEAGSNDVTITRV